MTKRIDEDEVAEVRVQIVTVTKWIDLIDAYRATQRPIPSRAEVIRTAVEEWVRAKLAATKRGLK